MGGELLGPDRDCSRDRSPALQAGSAFMELAGLEPATSWVRSRRGVGTTGASRARTNVFRSPARALIPGTSGCS
jgi:hypothetical protein